MLKYYVMWQNFLRNKRGQGMTEYVIVLSVVAVFLITTWIVFRSEIKNFIDNAIADLKNATK